MGTQQGSVNTTRLSLDIADLPLTPFGMSPHGSSRRHHIYPQRNNKLSLKTLKPLQEEKQASDLQREDCENKSASIYSRGLSQHSRNGLLGFRTLYEHCSSDLTDAADVLESQQRCSSDLTDTVDVRESQHLEGSEATVDSVVICDSTLSDRIQNQRSSTDESSRRGSIFTDIDDGSFIEFYHGKEKEHRVPKLKENQGRCTPQLYYTCQSQNETQYSTSTKKENAVVGFRKYVETVRRQKGLQEVIKGSKMEMFKMSKETRNLNSDETIITCSADMHKYRSKVLEKIAISSTMIEHVPCQVQVSFPRFIPDISALTEKTEVSSSDSTNPTPVMSPKHIHRKSCKNGQVIVISESSDDDSSNIVRALDGNRGTACNIRLRNQEGDNSKCRNESVGENYATSQPTVIWSQEVPSLLTSEDVSIVSSFASTGYQLQKQKRSFKTNPIGQVSSGLEEKVVTSTVKECTEEAARLVCDYDYDANDDDYDADCEEYKAASARTPEKPRVAIPDNAKSPAVAKWIISSPFKDSSFGSSFLQRNNTLDISETPSQPKVPGFNEPNSTSKNSDHGFLRDQNKSKKMSYSVSKARNSPRSLHSSSSSSADSSYSESCLKTKKYRNPRTIEESSSEESDGGDMKTKKYRNPCTIEESSSEESDVGDRMPNSRLQQNSDVKGSLSSPKHNCVDELDEKYCEMSLLLRVSEKMKRVGNLIISSNISKSSERSCEESLHLRLSEDLSKSNKTLEKTVCTIGRDATSPDTLRKSPASSSDGDISYKRKTRCVRVIAESESESDDCNDINDKDKIISSSLASDTPLPDMRIRADDRVCTLSQQTTSSSFPKSKEISHTGDNESKDFLDLRQIQKELDDLYSSEWRKNESSVLKNVTSENKNSVIGKQNAKKTVNSKINNRERPVKRVKEKTQRRLCFETDDEDETEEDSFLIEGSETASEDDVPDIPVRKGEVQVDASYCLPSETGDDPDDDSFEVYLKKVKQHINQDKKQQNNSVRKPLPPQTPQVIMPGYKLDSKACGSISDLKLKKEFEDSKKNRSTTSSSSWRDSPAVTISSDSDSDEVFFTEVKKKPFEPTLPFVTPKLRGLGKIIPKTEGYCRQIPRKYELNLGLLATPNLSFLASLSTHVQVSRCHPEASSYIKNFKKLKEQLLEKLYKYYNTHVFENKLPSDMSIKWNARMTKTAGFCYYQIDRSKPNGKGARIELSTKVIDTPERMRDTLIHELCHAAAWIISGYKAGHGPLWKAWAAKAIHTFPELPDISRCHSYEISCKYTYRCTKCSYSIGRHSKSLDTERKVCGYCHGKFELVVNSKQGGRREIGNGIGSERSQPNTLTQVPPKTPRTPGVFAMFVKENYGSVKKAGQNLKHADVMKVLSSEFRKMKASNN